MLVLRNITFFGLVIILHYSLSETHSEVFWGEIMWDL